jgi:Immunity protein Imm1
VDGAHANGSAAERRSDRQDYSTGGGQLMIVTASLTTGIARVADGPVECRQLIEVILRTEHLDWETILCVGDVEFRRSDDGPFPNHQVRVSARPSTGYAALNYMDHDDPQMAIANSYNLKRPLPDVVLVFNGVTGAVFPRSAAIPIATADRALVEWLTTRKRPTCIAWRSYDAY